ncbi:MAG: CsgG/HfaB family protein [Acidobacteriia bacterium]|jgi:curli biogenesis system outer membrane secretion channel CsgG|nr:CsgG/HfaB family protein [Terriglobia bacterium]
MERWIRRLWVCAAVFLFAVSAAWGADEAKKRVAIFDFDFGAVHHWWTGEWDIGKGISDMIVTNLVRDGTYSVIERKQLDRILQEQNFSNSDRVNPATAAKIGKVLGVNAIIIGTITQFGAETRKMDVGGVTSRIGLGALGGVGTSKSKASVVLDARMVNTETAEIMAVASGKGESKRGGVNLLGAGAGSAGGIDMNSSNFRETIIGEATRQAVDELTRQLAAQAEKVEATKIEINGLVADVTDNVLVLNVGKNQGLNVGDVVAIERVQKVVKDPSTGQVLRTITERIGTAKLTSVDAGSSMADFSGVGKPKVGDAVKAK